MTQDTGAASVASAADDPNKEIRALRRRLASAEAALERVRRLTATQKRMDDILSASFKKDVQFFHLVLDNMTGLLWLLDFDGRFAYASGAFLAEFGIAGAGLVSGRHYSEVIAPKIAPENLASLSAKIDGAAQGGPGVTFREHILFTSGRPPRTYMVFITPMTDDAGKTTGIMVLLNDITDIDGAMEAANRANAAKSEFLANMSHEIRTPMNAIIGMTAIGGASADLARKDACFAKISDASAHLLGIINDILDMSKIEANKFDLAPAPFNVERCLRSAVNVVSLRAAEKRQRIRLRIDGAIPPALVADDSRLAQVVANLLSNAVKFTPEGGRIWLRAALAGEADGRCLLRVSVRDNGIGITPEQQARLFSPFTQAESSTARKYGGTGLGLSICKSIVEMMGGQIGVVSSFGKGSTFTFTVQAARAGDDDMRALAALPAGGGEAEPLPDFSGRRVLLAEDVEINREILIALLEPTRLEIDCAANGAEAVAMYTRAPERYDLIFMDVQMPEMDGYDATRAIRASGVRGADTVPIVAMTANVFREDIVKCLAAGMDGHIGKPLNIDEIVAALRQRLPA